MKRDIEKDLIEIEQAAKEQEKRDNTFTASVLWRCHKLVSELKEYKEGQQLKDIKVKIIYRDGEEETIYVDDCGVKDGCFYMYRRYGVDSGTRHIPLDLIKEYITY